MSVSLERINSLNL